jgi:putative ABC transport system substrate-binding protein
MLDMKRREFIALVGGGGLLLATKARRARAQQPAMPVVGFLEIRSPEMIIERLRAFRQGLRETGYVEGENVTIDYRWAEQMEQLPELAGQLVRRQVAVIGHRRRLRHGTRGQRCNSDDPHRIRRV